MHKIARPLRAALAALAALSALAAPAALALILAVSAAAAAEEGPSLAEAYRDAAARIVSEAESSSCGYEKLAYLCDRIGHRLSGSPRLDRAIEWAMRQMKADGLRNVRSEEVMVPVWVRGEERAVLLEPAEHELSILGIGMSVGTPEGGITAEVVVVDSFAHVDSLGAERIRGKIVLYDVPYTGYGATVRYRGSGASHAAKFGAVAALVRSVSPISYDTPHTGMLRYEDDAPQIPAACVTIENATMMRRMARRGERIVARLEMGARMLPDAPSANVLGEVLGSEHPDEIVVIGGHLDSWDVGQGAQDDGVGCVMAMEAAHIIERLGLRPRRTIRVVLFTNEENGARGADAYRDAHRDELHGHVAAIEADAGNGPVRGFGLDIRAEQTGDAAADSLAEAAAEAKRARALAILGEIAPLLEPLGAGEMAAGGSGVDVGPTVAEGVPGIGVRHDTSHYFDVHHSPADTFDKIDAHDFARNVAAMTVMAFVLADMPGRLVEPHVVGTD